MLSFDDVARQVMTVTDEVEELDGGVRKQKTAFPEVAVRELLANCLIHQDLSQRGTSPMIEVFDNRIEFANAGAPLVDIERIVDTVPVSRNEALAGFMRKCGICEERGSGYDKVIAATCDNQLIAPIVQSQGGSFTKVALFPICRSSLRRRRIASVPATCGSVNSLSHFRQPGSRPSRRS